MNHNISVGKFGEELARKYLVSKGYDIVDLNHRSSKQEVDIIAKFKGRLIFFEIKTCASRDLSQAEDNMSRQKINNLKKALRAYIYSHKIDPDLAQIDFLAIGLDRLKKTANIKHYKDII